MPNSPSAIHNGQTEGAGLLTRIGERWRLWRECRRMLAELRSVAPRGPVDREFLRDIGVTQAELDELAAGPLAAGRQFEALAAVERVDLHAIRPRELREAYWACVHCECREPCKQWLQTGTWNHDGDSRCPNSELLHRHSERGKA
ncbi:MAG: hypothetical protein JO001_02445 [Alphaproteobacteria bacterium]|nr:hypothetical protein [Alphaproteobacteria bacterium]